MEAKEYVERRIDENGNQMIIETRKMGKWRRWLAKVYLPDTGRTLNEELIEKGLARGGLKNEALDTKTCYSTMSLISTPLLFGVQRLRERSG